MGEWGQEKAVAAERSGGVRVLQAHAAHEAFRDDSNVAAATPRATARVRVVRRSGRRCWLQLARIQRRRRGRPSRLAGASTPWGPFPMTRVLTPSLPRASGAQALCNGRRDGRRHRRHLRRPTVRGEGQRLRRPRRALRGRWSAQSSSIVTNYDGPIPNLSNLDIEAKGTTAFDPFLIGGPPVQVMAPVPATQLPNVPLGTVPGNLELSIQSGSVLTASYQGTCLTITGVRPTTRAK